MRPKELIDYNRDLLREFFKNPAMNLYFFVIKNTNGHNYPVNAVMKVGERVRQVNHEDDLLYGTAFDGLSDTKDGYYNSIKLSDFIMMPSDYDLVKKQHAYYISKMKLYSSLIDNVENVEEFSKEKVYTGSPAEAKRYVEPRLVEDSFPFDESRPKKTTRAFNKETIDRVQSVLDTHLKGRSSTNETTSGSDPFEL